LFEPNELCLLLLGLNLLRKELPREDGDGELSLSDPERGVGDLDFLIMGARVNPVISVRAKDSSNKLCRYELNRV